MSDWHRREAPHGLPGLGHQSFLSDNDDRMDEDMEHEIGPHTVNDLRVQARHSQGSAAGTIFGRSSMITGHQLATPTSSSRRRAGSLSSFRQSAISGFESERRVDGLPSIHQLELPAGSFQSDRVDRISSSLQLPNLNQAFHPGGSGLEFSSIHRPSVQTLRGLPSARPTPSQPFQSGRFPNGSPTVYESPGQPFHFSRVDGSASVHHSPNQQFHSRTTASGLPSAQQYRAAARAFHIGSTLQGSPTGSVPTASYTTPADHFAHGAGHGHTSASPESSESVAHLIPADPDEEAQSQTNTMAIPAGTPYAAIQFNHLANHLVARIDANDQRVSRMEEKLDNIAEAVNALREDKGSTAQPAAQVNAAAAGNESNETAAALKALNERLDNIEQQLAARKDDRPATSQQVVYRFPALDAGVESQHENGRNQDDQMDDVDQLPDKSSAPANKRRSLPNRNSGLVAAGVNRAKRARRNTAVGAEGTIHSDPLPSPAPVADRIVPLLLRPRVVPQVVGLSSGSSTPAILNSSPPAAEDEEGVKWASEFLSFLKSMDCTSDADLLRLRRYIAGKLSYEFPLCTSTEMGGYIQYYLKIGGQLTTPIAADPKDRPAQPQADEELITKLNILEFALDDKRLETARAMNPGQDHPHPSEPYLVPLGEVYAAHRSATKPQEVASTNFFVLMEVTSPKKSLWMVYRYEKPVQRRKDGDSQWGSIVFLNHRDSVFKGCRRRFDTVCLLEDVKEWRSPKEDMVDMGRFVDALPGDGSNVLQPVFYTPELKAVREAVRKGWGREGYSRKEE